MSTRVLAAVVFLLAITVGLAATNPTMGDYDVFVRGLLSQAVERMDQTGQGNERDQDRRMLRSQAKQLAASLLKSATVRRNYGLFSQFETRILGIDIVVLGIGNRFIPVKGIEDVNEKIHRLVPATSL
ncbi:MAG TPA: DUF4359 domain-containing protein [Nitrospiraceae bacterium]|jgi:hypothetical protein|nr:DUF4359 domain-containing protein [Nitrospiraceae bacterium]